MLRVVELGLIGLELAVIAATMSHWLGLVPPRIRRTRSPGRSRLPTLRRGVFRGAGVDLSPVVLLWTLEAARGVVEAWRG